MKKFKEVKVRLCLWADDESGTYTIIEGEDISLVLTDSSVLKGKVEIISTEKITLKIYKELYEETIQIPIIAIRDIKYLNEK